MISATIITLNEEKSIERAIKSLIRVADEVIVVDSGSKDATIEIARKLKAKVFKRGFDNFANQKNWAVAKGKGDWILALDADEEISPELAEEIREAIKSEEFYGYLIPRKNFILGDEIKYSRWSPDKHIWLWRKDYGRWVGDVHEEVLVNGKIGILKNSKIHHSHKTVTAFIKANNLYSIIEAKTLFKHGLKFSLFKMFFDSISEFCLRFFYKLGFLDKSKGFILSYLMGIYKLTVWIKVWELEKKQQ